jgi:hypothetical protein
MAEVHDLVERMRRLEGDYLKDEDPAAAPGLRNATPIGAEVWRMSWKDGNAVPPRGPLASLPLPPRFRTRFRTQLTTSGRTEVTFRVCEGLSEPSDPRL